MAITKGPLALHPDQIHPQARLVLREFVEYLTPNHTISDVRVDTNVISGDHIIVITLKSIL